MAGLSIRNYMSLFLGEAMYFDDTVSIFNKERCLAHMNTSPNPSLKHLKRRYTWLNETNFVFPILAVVLSQIYFEHYSAGISLPEWLPELLLGYLPVFEAFDELSAFDAARYKNSYTFAIIVGIIGNVIGVRQWSLASKYCVAYHEAVGGDQLKKQQALARRKFSSGLKLYVLTVLCLGTGVSSWLVFLNEHFVALIYMVSANILVFYIIFGYLAEEKAKKVWLTSEE